MSICATCTCCFGILVDLTFHDVGRLARALQIEPRSFVDPCPSGETDDDIGVFLEPGGETFTLVLRQRAASSALAKSKGRPCSFLMGPFAGEHRCGIYAHRPSACRSYPAEIDRRKVRLRSIARCLTEGTTGPALDNPQWRCDVRREQVEIDIHRIVAWRWNRHVLSCGPTKLDRYLEYLVEVHGRLEPLLDQLTTPVAEAWGALLDRSSSPLLDARAAARVAFPLAELNAQVERSFPDDPPLVFG